MNSTIQTDGTTREHSLSLKVMRLSQPNFRRTSVMYAEEEDIAYPLLRHIDGSCAALNPVDTTSTLSDEQIFPFGLTDALVVPQSFGFIYVGQRSRI